MSRIITVLIISILSFGVKGQTPIISSPLSLENPLNQPDTLKSFLVKKDPPYLHFLYMNHKEKPIFNKVGRGCIYGLIYNTSIMTGLILSPTWLNQWDNLSTRLKFESMRNQYKNSYTKPPVIDHDAYITNYLGHPYQGGFYYNSVRSQGANMLQSSLFCLGQTLVWEYVWEAGIEQPSIQDLIITPLAGILVGEACHLATIKMSKHGFNTLEKITSCIINPSWVINNKFIFNKKKVPMGIIP